MPPTRLVTATFAGLLLLPSSPVKADDKPLTELVDAVSTCIDRQFEIESSPALFAEIDLVKECPHLAEMLTHNNPVIATIEPDPDTGTLAQLADLRFLLSNMSDTRSVKREINYAGLSRILEQTLEDEVQQQEVSWWKRFILWLTDRYESRNSDGELLWLEELLEEISPSAKTARNILYACILLVAGLAIGLVANEIRIAKSGRSLPVRRRTPRNTRAKTLPGRSGVATGNLDRLPAGAPELLNICIDHLIRMSRLPEARSQTNREFLCHLQSTGDVAAPQFERLFKQAERVLYGGYDAGAVVIARCQTEARVLLLSEPHQDEKRLLVAALGPPP